MNEVEVCGFSFSPKTAHAAFKALEKNVRFYIYIRFLNVTFNRNSCGLEVLKKTDFMY